MDLFEVNRTSLYTSIGGNLEIEFEEGRPPYIHYSRSAVKSDFRRITAGENHRARAHLAQTHLIDKERGAERHELTYVYEQLQNFSGERCERMPSISNLQKN